jgi:prepilin-type N-terminal cleavage/methylation domain-containing protein
MDRLTTRGFTAVEVLVAIVILAIIATGIAQLLMRTTQALGSADDRRKAASLAGMVFEQYASYSAVAPDDLTSFDRVAVSPKDFFGTPDSLGYDGWAITSNTHCADQGSCAVTVAVWPDRPDRREMVFHKVFEESALNGADEGASGL